MRRGTSHGPDRGDPGGDRRRRAGRRRGRSTSSERALGEDLRDGPDVTTASTVPADQLSRANITPAAGRGAGRRPGGDGGVRDGARVGGSSSRSSWPTGTRSSPVSRPCVVRAPTASILTAERTALNLLTPPVRHRDRDPGLGGRGRRHRRADPGHPQDAARPAALEKYAVRCGGGVNHRMSLGDAALIKDNHVAAAGSVRAALRRARAAAPDMPCEVEVDTLDQFDEVVARRRTGAAGQLHRRRRRRRRSAGGGARRRCWSPPAG